MTIAVKKHAKLDITLLKSFEVQFYCIYLLCAKYFVQDCSPRSLFGKLKLSIFLDQWSKVLYSLFLYIPSCELLKYIDIKMHTTCFYLILKETRNWSKIRPLDFEKKMIAQLRKMFCKIPMNTHATDYLRYVTWLICLWWSIVWFCRVIRK